MRRRERPPMAAAAIKRPLEKKGGLRMLPALVRGTENLRRLRMRAPREWGMPRDPRIQRDLKRPRDQRVMWRLLPRCRCMECSLSVCPKWMAMTALQAAPQVKVPRKLLLLLLVLALVMRTIAVKDTVSTPQALTLKTAPIAAAPV